MEERWRPALHFSVATGFINDPNGLIMLDGRWHAFFQHNPHDSVHGPMHWGHAVSDDLSHWTELPIALYPDALGQCFSGSAVIAPDGNVALFYTAHLEREDHDPLQTQCLVRADRSLTRFQPEPSNPVLGNEANLTDYRDPKVFRHEPSSAWIMLITQGRHVGVYRSTDLVNWSEASEFGHALGALGDGAWECPDLVEVAHPDGGRRWVLIVGIWSGAPGGGSGTQYFLGEFDGYRFQVDPGAPEVLWLDHGRDYYAAQSFSGLPDSAAPCVLAWASNWQYANETPTGRFRGTFTLPREMELIDTDSGIRLLQRVPERVASAFPLMDDDGLPPGPLYRLHKQIALAVGERLEIRLFGEQTAQFTIEYLADGYARRLRLYRDSVLANGTVLTTFGSSNVAELVERQKDTLEIELFVDNGIVELFIDGGVDVVTMAFYPEDPAGAVSLTRHHGKTR